MAKLLCIWVTLVLCSLLGRSQGKLLLIGGGERTPAVMHALADLAALRKDDYVVVLPMATVKVDSTFRHFMLDYATVMKNPVALLDFSDSSRDVARLDSLRHARLIFITGGDQDRFMRIVGSGPVCQAIHAAYDHGATIAGSSAGAAVMAEHMITGQQLIDTEYHITFTRLIAGNVELKPGLGLVTRALIDQHFVVRSRYNRLLSAVGAYPELMGIGIDESTGIEIVGDRVTVIGSRQVIVFKHPRNVSVTREGLIKIGSIDCSIYTAGDTFRLL